MTKAVIFDMDGLLVDTEQVSCRIYTEILASFGYAFTKAEHARNYSGKTEPAIVTHLIDTYRLPWTLEEGLQAVADHERRLLPLGVDLKPGARQLLAYLKEHGYQTAIASSSAEERAMMILDQHGLGGYFDAFVFGHAVQQSKPAPDIFLLACEKLHRQPQDCLVLEDSEAGIQAAYAANIPVICIPDMKMPAQPFLDKTAAVLRSLDAVIPFLSQECP